MISSHSIYLLLPQWFVFPTKRKAQGSLIYFWKRSKKSVHLIKHIVVWGYRMCCELSAIGTKEPQYHLVAFIMKASVWANLLEEGQEKTIFDQKATRSDQKATR